VAHEDTKTRRGFVGEDWGERGRGGGTRRHEAELLGGGLGGVAQGSGFFQTLKSGVSRRDDFVAGFGLFPSEGRTQNGRSI
jgi:hypothetical protein